MPSTVQQLSDDLVSLGLFSPEEVDELERLAAETADGNVATLIDELVRRQRITEFQKQVLLAGSPQDLVLGEYTLRDLIGVGGMGRVFTAIHRRMQRLVAVKVLPAELLEQAEAVKRFEREAQVAARLVHPNVVTAYDAGQQGDTHYLVMEYVRGLNLQAVVRRGGPMSVADAVCCVSQACRGMAYAHAQGVVHRDIKPGNLLVDREGTVKVLDLGLARLYADVAMADPHSLSETGIAMGTLDYLPPEQAANAKLADHRCDIYSLGCTLYYLLSSEPPYANRSAVEKLLAHREAPVPSIRDRRPDVPAPLEAVLTKMLAKQPEERFQSMAEVEQALMQAMAASGGAVPSTPSFLTRLAEWEQAEKRPTSGKSAAGSAFQSTKRWSQLAANSGTATLAPTLEHAISRARNRGIPRWGILAGAVALVAAGIYAATLLMRVETPDGTLVLEVFEPDAIVYVDGQREATVSSADKSRVFKIAVDPGNHRLRITSKDGTEFFSRDFSVKPGGQTETFRARFEEPNKALAAGSSQPAASAASVSAATAADPNVLTVGKDGIGQFATLAAALDQVKPGQTIRVIDNAVYDEQVMLSLPNCQGITLEATAGATLTSAATGRVVTMIGLSNITVRGFHLVAKASPSYLFVVAGNSSGVVLEDMELEGTFGSPCTGISLETLQIPAKQSPVTVRRCLFKSLYHAVRISGLGNDYKTFEPSSGVRIVDNRFLSNFQAVLLAGAVSRVQVVGNRIHRTQLGGVQLEMIGAETSGVLVANNTLSECGMAVRLWDAGVKGSDIRIVNNLSLTPNGDWQFIDSGGDPLQPKGPGDGKAVGKVWQMSHNWRELPSYASDPPPQWIPLAETDVGKEEVELLSRDPASDDFLRPAANSPLATAGVGKEDASLPAYVGAVPPAGEKPWDWTRAAAKAE